MKKGDNNSSGVTSVILGILSIIFSIFPPVSILLGILGLVFGIVQFKSAKNKWSKAGIILSIIGIVLGTVLYFWALSVLNNPDFLAQLSQLQGATP